MRNFLFEHGEKSIFEQIIDEVKIRRATSNVTTSNLISAKIKKYFSVNSKTYPTTIYLGQREFAMFPHSYRFVSDISEVMIFQTVLLEDEDSKISFSSQHLQRYKKHD